MRARSARRLSVLPARNQLSSVDRSSGVRVRAVGYLLMPHHGISRISLQLSTSHAAPKTDRRPAIPMSENPPSPRPGVGEDTNPQPSPRRSSPCGTASPGFVKITKVQGGHLYFRNFQGGRVTGEGARARFTGIYLFCGISNEVGHLRAAVVDVIGNGPPLGIGSDAFLDFEDSGSRHLSLLPARRSIIPARLFSRASSSTEASTLKLCLGLPSQQFRTLFGQFNDLSCLTSTSRRDRRTVIRRIASHS